jgi:hypothetical protein
MPNLPEASWLGIVLAVVQAVQAVALAWMRRQQVTHRQQCRGHLPPSRPEASGAELGRCLCSVCSALGETCWHEVSPSGVVSRSPGQSFTGSSAKPPT